MLPDLHTQSGADTMPPPVQVPPMQSQAPDWAAMPETERGLVSELLRDMEAGMERSQAMDPLPERFTLTMEPPRVD